jgi:cob(I)alamin adenosyltransferase
MRSLSRTILLQQTRFMSTIKKSPIYTKTGDKGTSSLYNGERKPKDDLVFEALGGVDELNSDLGLAREFCLLHVRDQETRDELAQMIMDVQNRLLDVGASVATPIDNSTEKKLERVKFYEEHLTTLEKWIDLLDHRLPPLRNFILPGGGVCAAQLHVARTVCRTAERRVVPLVREDHVDPIIQRYLNRLSDFLFVAARTATRGEGKEEVIWKKAKSEEES